MCLTNSGLAVPLDQATLPLQEIAKTAYPGLKPEQVVARMIADGSNPILSAKAVAQIAAPEVAPSIAASAASAVPEAAADIAAAVAQVVPDQAMAIAAAVGKAVPAMAPQIAATVAQVVPKLAAQIAQAMGAAVPQAAGAVSTAVAGVVPGVSGFAATVSTIGAGTVIAGAVGVAAVGAAAAAVEEQANNESAGGYRGVCTVGRTRNKGLRRTIVIPPLRLQNTKTCRGDRYYIDETRTFVTTQTVQDTEVCELRGTSMWMPGPPIASTPVEKADPMRNKTDLVYCWADEICVNGACVCNKQCEAPRVLNPANCACDCPPCAPPRILNQQTCACDCPACESPFKPDANCNCVIVRNGSAPETRIALAEPLQDNTGACACQQCRRADSASDSVSGRLRH